MTMIDTKIEKTQITDEAALDIFLNDSSRKVKVATKFVPRTIVYPVEVESSAGKKAIEIRTFVRMNEYCSPSQWEKALELEKTYAKLNKRYTEELKKKGLPVSAKEVANPLKATVLDLR